VVWADAVVAVESALKKHAGIAIPADEIHNLSKQAYRFNIVNK
jgi:hypothetical protein